MSTLTRADVTLKIDWRDVGSVTDAVHLIKRDPAVGVVETIPVIRDSDELASALPILSAACSIGVEVDWWLSSISGVPVNSLAHLPPPASVGGRGDMPDLLRWKSTWRYGLFYYRRGPGFVQIRDRRPGQDRRIILDNPNEVNAFEGLAERSQPMEQALLATFLAADIIWESPDGTTCALPYRIRTWPTPYMGI